MSFLSRLRYFAALLCLAFLPGSFAQGAQLPPSPSSSFSSFSSPGELDLEAALAAAFARSPVLAAAEAELAEARGRATTARTFPYNPELELELGERDSLGSSSTDRRVSLSQQLQIGGQRGKETRAAEYGLAASEARLRHARKLLAANVSLAFADSLAAKELAQLAATELDLARELLEVTQRLFAAGRATQVNMNLARASAARTERRSQMAHASYLEMRSLLAEVVGLDPTQPPIPAGPLNLPSGEPATLSVLVQGALEHRDDLAALQQVRRATEERRAAAVAARVPDLSLSAYFEEEASTDRIVGAGLRISLPFFQRNQGAIAEAHAAIDRASAELESRERAIRRQVFSTLSRYRAARSSAQTLAHHVVGTLTESLDLLGRSFAAGKIGLPDLLLSRRELIEGQREFIEAVAAAWVARVTLDLAVGRVPGLSDLSATRLEVLPSQVTPESES